MRTSDIEKRAVAYSFRARVLTNWPYAQARAAAASQIEPLHSPPIPDQKFSSPSSSPATPLSLSFLQKQQNIVASMPTPTENDSIRIKGEKRSPELESPVNKKAKITNGKTISPKTHSTNLIFRKFVNNALTEKAAVGFLCIPSFLRNISLTMDYRGTQ